MSADSDHAGRASSSLKPVPTQRRDWVPHPLRPYAPLIVNVALTGMVPMPPRVPHVPITPEAIVRDAVRCAQAGATIVHLHARDEDGRPTWRRQRYQEFIPAIREQAPGLTICVSTSGRTFGDIEQRADVLRLTGQARPDMASLTLGSLNFRDQASVNAPGTILELARRMRDVGIRPELEVFDSGMAYQVAELLERGELEPPLYANVLLGSPGSAPARAADLLHLVSLLPPGTVWAAAGIGAFQSTVSGLAVFIGGHVRTGLEDASWLDPRTREPATNETLVRRCAELASLAGRELAAPQEVRAQLGLSALQGAAPGPRSP
jgi:uncharacterized protein (DUF849 family)